MGDFNAVIVGSGINSLVAGAMLAKAGWKVCLLERSDYFGGAIHTAEITRPGYHHELYSAWYPLWTGGGAYQELKADLDARGITFLSGPISGATVHPDGQSGFVFTSAEAIAAEFERLHLGDGEAYMRFVAEFSPNLDLLFGFLGADLGAGQGEPLLQAAQERLGRDGFLRFTGEMLGTCREWLTQTFASPMVRSVYAPWITHAGLGPEDALSGMMMRTFALTMQFMGMPVPQGGGSKLVQALIDIIESGGGECHTHADVSRVLVESGTARGVQLANGQTITADRAVLCNVTPTQLYQRLLAPENVPADRLQAAKRFRFGLAGAQLHLALKEAPQWKGDPRLNQSPAINLVNGLDGLSKAWNEGIRGLIPEDPVIFVGNPTVLDPSRAPAGGAVLMLQLLGLPNQPVGDAGGTIKCEGVWTEAVADRFADRVLHVLSRHVANLPSALIDSVMISPADLEANNINHGMGDPYGGALQIAQHYFWRPMPGYPRHATHIGGLYQIGASTYPGHGLSGGSGLLVAKELLR